MPKIPEKYFRDFLRGCIDGDGSISCGTYNKNKGGKTYIYPYQVCYLCGSSKQFLVDIKYHLDKLNIIGYLNEVKHYSDTIKKGNQIIKIKTTNPHYRLAFSSKNTYKLMKLIYYPDHQLSLN